MEKAKSQLEIITRYFADLSAQKLKQFAELGPLYREWNEKINVISRKDIDALFEKHVLHSLAIAAIFDFPPHTEIIDIGTGGGFPGLPLAIYFPDVCFHLVDATGKKLKVVNAVAAQLGLQNLTTEHTRVESIKNRKFDFAVSRAVAPLKDLWKWARPMIRNERKLEEFKNGLICLKGGDLAEEISESRLRPYIWDIHKIFDEAFFKEKYVLYVPV